MIASAALLTAGPVVPPVASFPFAFQDGLIRVRVNLPMSDRPLRFLLDSGAGASALNLATARRLGLRLGEPIAVHGVHTQSIGYWSERLTATVGEVRLSERFLVVDLDALGRDCRCAVDGLLGADFFRHRVVQLDFDAQRVRWLAAAAPLPTSWVLPLRVRRSALLLPLGVNDRRSQWVRLDTGCSSALEWVVSGRLPQGLASRISIGLSEVSIPTASTTVELGGHRFEGVLTGLHETRIFPGEAGLLGNALLSRFNVTVDAATGRLILDRRRAR